jgi:hypothetical protein
MAPPVRQVGLVGRGDADDDAGRAGAILGCDAKSLTVNVVHRPDVVER